MSLYAAAITLLLVMDPFGNIPLFLAVLERVDERRRRMIIVREMLIALVVLTGFLFFGRFVLAGMHITEPALSLAGGVILFLIALRMIFPGSGGLEYDRISGDPVIVPLAIPLVAGPSAISTIILFSTSDPAHMLRWLLALALAWLPSAAILYFAEGLARLLGRRVLGALERLMGMILTTLATQMLLAGLTEYLRMIGAIAR